MSSCRRSRELLELFRYGHPDERSEAQLRHLDGCEPCRGELGCDRQLVRQLQRALEARVEGAAPSPAAWAVIRRQAELQRTERRPGWIASLVALARGAAGAAAVSALAVVLIVFGGDRQIGLPPSGSEPVPATPSAGVSEEPAPILGRVPAERLQAPSRPDAAEIDVRLRPPATGKRPGMGTDVDAPQVETGDGLAAGLIERVLQGEAATQMAVASVVEPTRTSPPQGGPL